MNEAENLPSRGAWFATEDGRECQPELFSGGWFSLTSSAKRLGGVKAQQTKLSYGAAYLCSNF
jgi:hypothetical protein